MKSFVTVLAVLGCSLTALAEDKAAMAGGNSDEMMDMHAQMTMKQSEMLSMRSQMMEMHAKAVTDKTMAKQKAALMAASKEAKAASVDLKKMSDEMAKAKGLPMMDPSKMDPKMKELMDKHMAMEKEMMTMMQKDMDMMEKMHASGAGATPPVK